METALTVIDYYAQACGNEAQNRAMLARRYHFDPHPPKPESSYDTRLLARVGLDTEAAAAVRGFTWRYHVECGKQVAGPHLVEVTNEAMVQAWELAGKPAANTVLADVHTAPSASVENTVRAGAALLAQRPALAAFLTGLPSLELSDTGRRNVAARFGLSDPELTAALVAVSHQQEKRP